MICIWEFLVDNPLPEIPPTWPVPHTPTSPPTLISASVFSSVLLQPPRDFTPLANSVQRARTKRNCVLWKFQKYCFYFDANNLNSSPAGDVMSGLFLGSSAPVGRSRRIHDSGVSTPTRESLALWCFRTRDAAGADVAPECCSSGQRQTVAEPEISRLS